MAWNGSGGSTTPQKSKMSVEKPSFVRGIVAGLLVVAIALGTAFYFTFGTSPQTVKREVEHKKDRIKEVSPALTTNKPEVVVKKDEINTNDPHRVVEVLSVTTNKSIGKIYARVRRADGLVGKVVTPVGKPIFKYGTDQLLQMMLCNSSAVGLPPMPMRRGGALDKEFLASLKDEIVITDGDSEKIRFQKETVIRARAEIKELMDKGYHFDDILNDYRRLTSENREIRNKAMRELNAIHESGDVEAERKYQITIDAALQQMGIDPLDKPMTSEERRAAHEERRAQRLFEKQNTPK